LPKEFWLNFAFLVVKMVINFTSNSPTNANLDLLHDIEVIYGLIFFLPMQKFMNNHMKLAQAQNVFVVEIMW
jgi:hypothetical protein